MTRNDFARQLREARKTPEGRKVARIVWLAYRRTVKHFRENPFSLLQTKGALSRIVASGRVL